MASRRRAHEDEETNYGKRPRRDTSKQLLEIIRHRLDDLGNHRGNSIELRLENLALFLSDKLDEHKQEILGILMKSIQANPIQSTGFATLVGLMNVKRFGFGGEALQFTMLHLGEQMRIGSWDKARYLLCFLAGLVNANVVTAGSYLQLLSLLMLGCEVELEFKTENQIKEEMNDESELGLLAKQQQQEIWLHRRHDWITYTVLSTLVLVGRELYEKKESGLNSLLITIQIYVKKSSYRRHLSGSLLRVWSKSEPMQLDCLDALWHQIDQLHSDGWMDKYYLLPRPYLAFDNLLSGALNHALPAFQPPDSQPSNTAIPPPNSWIVFRIFEFQETGSEENTKSLPEALSIERYLIDREINEIFKFNHLDRKLCADQLIEYAESKPDVDISHCIIEYLMGKILQLPLDFMDPKVLAMNSGAILIELYKRRPIQMGCIIGEAVEILYRQLDTMNVACFDRFVNWFSHHLSNFRFEWNWQIFELNSNETLTLHPNAVFLRELLKKCVRFSYYDNIVRVIPETFRPLMPPTPLPQFKYVDELLTGSRLASELLQAMRSKCAPEMIIDIITKTNSLNMLYKIEILMQCFVHLGSKSFSHTFALFTKYQSQLKSLVISEDEQHSVLAAICDVWKSNEQFQVVLMQKLLFMRIINAKCIVSWFFSPAQMMELTKMYVWEIIYVSVRFIKYPHRFLTPEELSKDEEDGEKTLRKILMDVVQRFVKVISLHQHAKKNAAMKEEQEEQKKDQMQEQVNHVNEQKNQMQDLENQVQVQENQILEQEEKQVEAKKEQEQPEQMQIEQSQPKETLEVHSPPEEQMKEQTQQKEQKQDVKEKEDYWLYWILGRLQEFLLMHMFEFRKLGDRLKTIAMEAEHVKGVSKIIYTFLSLNT